MVRLQNDIKITLHNQHHYHIRVNQFHLIPRSYRENRERPPREKMRVDTVVPLLRVIFHEQFSNTRVAIRRGPRADQ